MPRKTDPGLTQQYVSVGVSGGIEKKADPKLVRAPATLDAQNLRYTTEGAIQKRLGLSNTSLPMPAGNIVTSIGQTTEELLVTDNKQLYAYNPQSRQWAVRGLASNYMLSSFSMFEYTQASEFKDVPANISYAVCNDVGLLVYEDLQQIRIVCYDATSGRLYWKGGITRSPTPAFDFNNIILYGNSADLWYQDTAAKNPLNNPTGVTPSQGFYCNRYNDIRPKVAAFDGKFYIALQHSLYLYDTGDSMRRPAFVTIGNVMVLDETPEALTQKPLNILAAAPDQSRWHWVLQRCPLSTAISPVAIVGGDPKLLTSYYAAQQNHYYDLKSNGFELYYASCGCYNTYRNDVYPDNFTDYPDICKTYVWDLDKSTGKFPAALQAAVRPPNAIAWLAQEGATKNMRGPYAVAFSLVPSDTSKLTAATIKGSGAMWLLAYTTGYGTLSSRAASGFITGLQQAYGYLGDYSVLINVPPPSVVAAVLKPTDTPGVHRAYITDAKATSIVDVAYYGAVIMRGAYPLPIEGGASVPPEIYSEAFLTDDGTPAVWLILRGVKNQSLGSLVCVALDETNTIARALYLRLGVLDPQRDGYFDTRQNWPITVMNASVVAAEFISQETSTVAYRSLRISRSKVSNIATVPRRGAILTGGVCKYYDGNTVRVLGYNKIPEIESADLSGLIDRVRVGFPIYFDKNRYKDYSTDDFFPSYIFVWEDFDANGAVMYSSPSPAYTPNKVINPYNSSYAPGYAVTRFNPNMTVLHPSSGQVAIYRTSINSSLYSRITLRQSDKQLEGGYLYDVLPNTVTGTPLLYSQPTTDNGELPNDPPPAASYVFSTPTRAWAISAERPTQAYYSKPYFQGRVPEFNEAQVLDIDPASGPIVGGASLDQAVVFFKRERILLVGGTGPDATGAGAFNETTPVPTDAGCIDVGSIITNEQGVYFRSYRGIHLLNRGYQVQYVGGSIEPLLKDRTVLSACLVANQSQIRFGLDNGVALIFDYSVDRWSVYNYSWSNNPPLRGQVSFKGQWYGLLNNQVLTENDGATGDLNNIVPMVLETAWLPIAGPTGWGRVRRATLLGDWKSTHTATLSWLYDYDDSKQYDIPYTATFDAQRTPYEWRVRAPRQVCQAVKLRLTATGPGLSMNLTGISLETSVKSGAAHTSVRTSV